MSPWFIVVAAVLLSLERIAYVVIWRAPDTFCTFCARPMVRPFGEPIDILQKFFYGFKGVQLAVFFGWCYGYGNGKLWPPDSGGLALCIGALLIVAGQLLNYSVFAQLGKVGVFYGNKMGYGVPWCRDFPFSVLNHPQYIGASLSIWGFFLVMRFPYDDWYVLPAIETLYYALGAHFEQ